MIKTMCGLKRSAVLACLTGCLFVSSVATADSLTKPYIKPERARDAAPYLINIWTTMLYQTVSGRIVDGSGPVEVPEDPVTDLEGDLGLEAHLAVALSAKLEHRNKWWPDVRFDYTPLEFNGEHALSKNLRIGQMSFRDGQVVQTKLHAVAFDFTLLYHPLRVGSERRPWLDVALGVTARSTQARLNVTGIGIWRVGSERYDVPILPMGFLSIDIAPYRVLGLRLEGRGISDGTNQWWDGIGELRSWPLGPTAWIGLGARYQHLDVTQENEGGLKAKILSWQGSLGLRF